MSEKVLDFRSDTATKPTPEMYAAICSAPVGDDVQGEDPTINALEERIAAMLGKEAAIYVPSGTMSNQIAVRVQTSPGDEVLCEAECHVYMYEQGGYAQLSGVAVAPIPGRQGILETQQLASKLRPENTHFPRTRLLLLENTHNRGGGRIQPYDTLASACSWAHEQGLATHLDGARLFNAVVASGIAADQWAQHFDTVSVCFSKGLGAPVGSALIGSPELIAEARRHRKVLGGGMRQGGVIAAAALYALENHIERLADDHDRAQALAAAVRDIPGLDLVGDGVDTNIVLFAVDPQVETAPRLVGRLKQKGLLTLAMSPTTIRMVTHLDVDARDTTRACELLREAVTAATRGDACAPAGESYG